jgi:hypothetical protein
MRICFDVETCYDCPFIESESPDCSADYYYCNLSDGHTLATEKKVKIRDAAINLITQQVTAEEYKWMFITPEGKEWKGEIPDSCPYRKSDGRQLA